MTELITQKQFTGVRAILLGTMLLAFSGVAMATITTCALTGPAATAINSAGYQPTSSANGCSTSGGFVDFVNFSNTAGPAIWAATDGNGNFNNAGGSWTFDTTGATNFSTFTYEATTSSGTMSAVSMLPSASFTCKNDTNCGTVATPNTVAVLTMLFCNAASFSLCSGANEATLTASFEATGTGNTGIIVYNCVAGGSGFTCPSGSSSSINVPGLSTIAVQLSLAVANQGGNGGHNDTVTFTNLGQSFASSSVPEPATSGLVGLSLLALGSLRLRRKKSDQ